MSVLNEKALAVRKPTKKLLPKVNENERTFTLSIEPGRIKPIVLDKKSGSLEEQALSYIDDLNRLWNHTEDELTEFRGQLQTMLNKLYQTPAGAKIKKVMDDINDCQLLLKEIPIHRSGAMGMAKALGLDMKKDIKSKMLNPVTATKQLTGGTK
jgi:hypothetical protein